MANYGLLVTGVFGEALKAAGTLYEVSRHVQASAGVARRWIVTLCSLCTTALRRMNASDGSMQSSPCHFRRAQVALTPRVTPYAMAGHIVNTTVLAVALAGSVRPAQLLIWCVYSYSIALLLLYRRLKNHGRSPRSVERPAKKAAIYAFFLALPWSSAAVLHLGTLSDNEERILVALAVGMAASGTILLSAVPRAALIYMSAILIPFALKCAILNQKSYLLLGVLALSCWGFLAALITKIAKGNQERQRTEQALTERNLQLALAGEAALVGSYSYDVGADAMQVSEGYAAVHGLATGTVETTRSEWRARTHPGDFARVENTRKQAFRERRAEYDIEYRIVRSDGEVRWIESRSFISYATDGTPQRVIGVNIDITQRKRLGEMLAERNAQLDLAHRAARVGSYTCDIPARTMRIARASAGIYGLSHSTMEIAAQQWFARVHRDDMQRLRAEHIRAFKERRHEMINEFRFVVPGGEVRCIEARSLIAYDQSGRAERMTGVYIDVTERRKAEDHKSLLIAELDHRVKNVLACVAAIAQRSRECVRSADEFLEVLNGRINALANTHALLSRSRWQGVGLGELVRTELAFCSKEESSLIEGPEVDLAAEATQPVAMVLHELATNAAKYGALSNGHGRVLVRWRRPSNGRSLVLEWQETGGPPVVASKAAGFGTSVIRDLIPYELGGAVDYELAREGARCRLEIPPKWVSQYAP